MSSKTSKSRVPDIHEFKTGQDQGSVTLTMPAGCPYSDHGRPPPLVPAWICKSAPAGAPEGLRVPALCLQTVHPFSSGLSRLLPSVPTPRDALILLPPKGTLEAGSTLRPTPRDETPPSPLAEFGKGPRLWLRFAFWLRTNPPPLWLDPTPASPRGPKPDPPRLGG